MGQGSEVNTIAKSVQKKVDQAHNPILALLGAKPASGMAFSSNAPRFQEKVADESEAFLGPGYYDHRSQFVNDKQRNRPNQSAKIILGGA